MGSGSCPKCDQGKARVLLPLGEGGPKGRMRVDLLPSPAASRLPLPEGEGPRLQTAFSLAFKRFAKRNWDTSA